MSALFHPFGADLLNSGLIPPAEMGVLCLPGTRLQHVKKVGRRIEVLLKPFRGDRRAISPETVLFAKHDHRPLRRPKRPIDLSQFANEIMLTKISPVFWNAVGITFNGSVAAYQECPWHPGQQSLRIFPASESGDFFFRCHHCGTTLSTIEFVARRKQSSIAAAAAFAWDWGMVAEPVSDEAITTLERLTRFRNLLNRGRDSYATLVTCGMTTARYGDVLAFSKPAYLDLLRDLPLAERRRRETVMAKVYRNVFGFPARVVFYSKEWLPLTELRFGNDAVLFDSPRRSDFCSLDDLIACPDEEMALAMERAVRQWPAADQVGVTVLSQTTRPLTTYSPPLHHVWLVKRYCDSAEYGLPLSHSATHVRVVNFHSSEAAQAECSSRSVICDPGHPSCMEWVANHLARDRRPLHTTLSTILTNPAISPAVGKELIARTAELQGLDVASVAARIDNASNPFGLQLGGATYLCRDGRFLKKSKRKTFGPISNFAVRITSPRPHRAANSKLDLELTIGADRIQVTVSDAEFNNPQRLWKAIRSAAGAAGLGHPVMSAVSDRKLLPEIIRGTHGPQMAKAA